MPSLIPDRRNLVRTFTDAVTAAVEATIAERTRSLLAGRASANPKSLTADLALETPIMGAWPTLAQHQWTYIQQVLARTNGNRSEAAVILGLHRRSLQRLLARGSARARARGKRAGRKSRRA